MQFSGDIGLWQRRIAEGPEGARRRLAVFEALALRLGQTVLDVGCGGGHLLVDLAQAVGDTGRAVGFDISAEQLAAARERLAGLPVDLVEGDATALPFDDARFDALASIQTLEYIADVDAALAQGRRVLRRGGRAALVSTLWDQCRFHGADPHLTGRLLDAFRAHCPHQMLPFHLPGRLEKAGFGGVGRAPIAVLNGALNENCYAYWVAKIVAGFAIARGIDESAAADWLEQLGRADREGRFGFVSLQVLTTATAL